MYFEAKPWLVKAERCYDCLTATGGFTYDRSYNQLWAERGSGYFVSILPNLGVQIEGHASSETLAECLYYLSEKNKDCALVGGWYDAKTGRTYVDLTVVVPTKSEAIELAKLHSQKAIYNRTTGEVENVD